MCALLLFMNDFEGYMIGELKADNLVGWLRDENNRPSMIYVAKEVRLKKLFSLSPAVTDNFLNGKAIVATGAFANFTRDGINKELQELGVKAGFSVSKKTEFLSIIQCSRHCVAIKMSAPGNSPEALLRWIINISPISLANFLYNVILLLKEFVCFIFHPPIFAFSFITTSQYSLFVLMTLST